MQWLLISGADMHARNRKGQTPVSIAMQTKDSDVGCLFKKGSRIAAYETVFQGCQPGCRSTSLQRLWAAYLDKQPTSFHLLEFPCPILPSPEP